MSHPLPTHSINAKLAQQLAFIVELDKLKRVLRQTLLTDGSRQENSAEHSWHIAMMAMVLQEYALPGTQVERAIQMLLLHDVVEIYAGDTFCYDDRANQDKEARERAAADRLFGMLPAAQDKELRACWEEFEAGETPSAKFANALDRLQPFLHNQQTQGGTWKAHGIAQAQVLQRMRPIQTGTPELWGYVEGAIAECVALGYLR